VLQLLAHATNGVITMPGLRQLSGKRLSELMGLLAATDSVELKMTVPDAHRQSTTEALRLDPLDGQIRQVVFFDTPDLVLDKRGVVVRCRRVQNDTDDTVVKLRPVQPDTLPKELRKLPQFVVEVDAMPGGYVCSGSFKGDIPAGCVREMLDGKRPIHKLFSKQQREFFRMHAPQGLELDDLSVLGPITVLKLKLELGETKRRMVAEAWFYPDGSRIMELSTKCLPSEAFQVAAEARVFLAERGIDVSGEQSTKTRTALEYFSGQLVAAKK